ncbi:aminopeptidase N [Harpegnathos saltator]|uniref:aminopeptidase N n=1 Tax=Harpegnathos saltator TaxID=610380 RepID=UPI000DBEE9B6|nr:aminopeptidase N [Harpegnathos saltator]
MMSGVRIEVMFLTLSIYAAPIFSSEFDTPLGQNLCYFEPLIQNLLSVVQPIYYSVFLKIEELSFQGEVRILFGLIQRTYLLIFHAKYLEIGNNSVVLWRDDLEIDDVDQPIDIYYCNETSTIILKFDEILCPGNYSIVISYRGLVNKTGFYRIKEEKGKRNVTWSYVMLLEPESARYIFPCQDESTSKAIFYIIVQHLAIYHVYSNAQKQSVVHINKTTTQTTFQPTPPMGINLLRITLINFNKLLLVKNDLWYGQEGTNETDPIIKNITNVIDDFLWLYMDKRLETSIIVVFSDLLGNTVGARQLIFLRESDLIYKNDTHFPGRIIDIWKTIAYRKAEQYIQSFIHPNHWSHTWFNKALALYLSYNILGQGFDKERMMQLFVVQVQLPAMHNDIVLKVPSILRTDDPFYSTLIYKKASVLLRMLEHIVSKEKFHIAIVEYLNTCKYRTSTPNKFFSILSKFNEMPENVITDIMSIWLSRSYYPVLVARQYDKTYHITCNEINKDHNDSIIRPIPVTYTTKEDPHFDQYGLIHWLNNNYTEWNSYLELTLDNVEEWVILNVQYFGYYRVRYDNTNWLKIAYFLKEDNGKTISVLNRAQLIDDAYHFVMMGTMDYKFYYELIDFLRNETDFIVWHSMMNVLHYMSPFFKFPESEGFKNFIIDIMNDALTQIGYDEKPTDDNMLKSTRLLLLNWMCNHGNDKCREAASDKLRIYFKNAQKSPILPGWRNWVFCAGLMKPDHEVRTLMKHKILHEMDENIVQYMTCYDDDDSIQDLLNWVIFKPRVSIFPMAIPLNDVQKKHLYRVIVKKHARKSKILDFILKNIFHLLPGNMTLLEKLGHVIMSVHSKCQMQKITEYINYNINLDKSIYEAERILMRRMSQISTEKDMFVHRFPYNVKDTEC